MRLLKIGKKAVQLTTISGAHLCKHKKKHTPKNNISVVNSRFELLKTRQQFCRDISTLFQSHCQTRISYLQTCYHIIYKETGRDDVLETLHY